MNERLLRKYINGILSEYVLGKPSQFLGGSSGNQVVATAKKDNRLSGPNSAFKTKSSGKVEAFTIVDGDPDEKIDDIPNGAFLNLLSTDESQLIYVPRGTGQSKYAKVSLVGGSHGEFLINISHIEHDIPFGSDRTKSGSAAQDSVLGILTQAMEQLGYEITSGGTAAQGSADSDVTITAKSPEGKKISFNAEVKSMKNNTVKMFDKTINLGGTKASHELDLINSVAKLAFETNRGKIESVAKEVGVTVPNIEGLVDYVELLSQLDLGAGFSSPESKSGKLPVEYFSLPPGKTSPEIVSAIAQHFAGNDDSYFVISRGGGASFGWYTGHGEDYAGLSEYGMDMGSFLDSFNIKLSTYGTPFTTKGGKRVGKLGSMRVALTFVHAKGGRTLPRAVREMKSLAEVFLRKKVRNLLSEALTKTDKKEIARIAKKQARLYTDAELEKALGKSFFGTKGKVNQFVEDEISKRFKAGDKDKDFADAVERVAKRVIQALYTLHSKRANLIKNMPVPKG